MTMILKKILAVLGATTAIGAISGPQPQAESTTERAHSREIHKLRDAQRHANHLRVLHESDTAAIAWGNERRPNRTVVFTLDEPIEKTTGKDIVEIELFSPGLDNDGTADVTSCAMTLALRDWWPTVIKAELPVHLAYRQVDEGPGLDARHREGRRTITELVVGGSVYSRNNDDRGARIVGHVMERLRQAGLDEREITVDLRKALTGAGIDAGEWEEETREEVKQARTANNARWTGFAQQYARWRGHDPRGKRALGQGAAPIMLVDGCYLITMNTIRRQGGLRAPEKLFQTVNAVIREQIEQRKTAATEEPTMNQTAATVMAAAIALGACAETGEAEVGDATRFLSRAGWKSELGPVEVLPDAAHLRLKSGRVVRLIFLEPLEGREARGAQGYLTGITRDRKVNCGWHHEGAEQGDARTVTPEGIVIASCRIRKKSYASCLEPSCYVSYQAVLSGHGRIARGPWESRTQAAVEELKALEAGQEKAREAGQGLWSAN